MSNPFTHEKRKVLTVLERAQLFALDADHVIPLSGGGTNAFPDNWQTLCSWCHDDKSYGEGGDISRAAKSKRIYARHHVPSKHQRSRSWGRR
jgi:cytochrome c553